jgi:hypothetical protein
MPPVPKFIKKLDSIPEIALPEEQPIKIALVLYGALAFNKNHR